MTDGTTTQPDPNISTEHQRDGDARHPSDTLDRDRARGDQDEAPAEDATTKGR